MASLRLRSSPCKAELFERLSLMDSSFGASRTGIESIFCVNLRMALDSSLRSLSTTDCSCAGRIRLPLLIRNDLFWVLTVASGSRTVPKVSFGSSILLFLKALLCSE